MPVSLLPVGTDSIHNCNLPRGSLDTKFQSDITKQCTPLAQQGPEPMLFTSYLANGHLRSFWPTNDSYPLSWMVPMVLQGLPLRIYRQQDHCCFCCSLQWLLLLMFILSFYPLKHIRLTRQHACAHARCCLSASKMSEISSCVDTAAQTQYAPFNGESSHVVFFLTEYILFMLVQPIPPLLRISSIQLLCFLSVCIHWHISQGPGPAVD